MATNPTLRERVQRERTRVNCMPRFSRRAFKVSRIWGLPWRPNVPKIRPHCLQVWAFSIICFRTACMPWWSYASFVISLAYGSYLQHRHVRKFAKVSSILVYASCLMLTYCRIERRESFSQKCSEVLNVIRTETSTWNFLESNWDRGANIFSGLDQTNITVYNWDVFKDDGNICPKEPSRSSLNLLPEVRRRLSVRKPEADLYAGIAGLAIMIASRWKRPSATKIMASASVVIFGAVQPKTSPTHNGLVCNDHCINFSEWFLNLWSAPCTPPKRPETCSGN